MQVWTSHFLNLNQNVDRNKAKYRQVSLEYITQTHENQKHMSKELHCVWIYSIDINYKIVRAVDA